MFQGLFAWLFYAIKFWTMELSKWWSLFQKKIDNPNTMLSCSFSKIYKGTDLNIVHIHLWLILLYFTYTHNHVENEALHWNWKKNYKKLKTYEAYMNETLVQEEGQRKECFKVQKRKERKSEIHQNLYAYLENSRDQITIIH